MDKSPTTIPDPVRLLLRDQLTSFERLAVVLLLHKRAPDELSAQTIADQLQMRSDLVTEALTGLAGGGLVEAGTLPQAWRFAPTAVHLSDAVSALRKAYCEQRAAIAGQLSLNAIERIRSGPQIPAGDPDVPDLEQASSCKPDL
jgi:hypothetical protein